MVSQLLYAIRRARWELRERIRSLMPFPGWVLLALEGEYPELPPPAVTWWSRRFVARSLDLVGWRALLECIAADRHVRGVVFRMSVLRVPAARLEVMRQAIVRLREAGKRVVVWASHLDTGTYWLASAADEIVLQPGGSVGPLGLSQRYLFLGAALERIGVGVDFVRSSPYKTAFDPYSRREMSEEMREMGEWLLDSTYTAIVRDIATGRRVTPEEVERWIDRSPYTDEEALAAGLIDGIHSEEALGDRLRHGEPPLPLRHVAEVRRSLPAKPPRRPGRYIALIRLTGTLVDGRSQRPPVPLAVPLLFDERAGDLTLIAQIRRAQRDRRAAAVVLYVDSPGGSATASEAIASAVARLAAAKPVVVAMGSVAASGGYYVASQAHWIVAHAHTLTGSIGVLSGKWVNEGLLERLLVHREHLSRGANALLYDPGRPFTEAEREELARRMERVYRLFLERVAAGRRLTVEQVDAVGGGRVWTGAQALERGLVDQIGGFGEAVEKACELAGLPAGAERVPVRELLPGPPRAPVPAPPGAPLHIAEVPAVDAVMRGLAAARGDTAPATAVAGQLLSYAGEALHLLGYPRLLTLCPLVEAPPTPLFVGKIS